MCSIVEPCGNGSSCGSCKGNEARSLQAYQSAYPLLASRDPSQAMMQKKAVSVEGSSDGCHVTGIKLGEKDHEPKTCYWPV